MKRGKNYLKFEKLVDKDKIYQIEEAIDLVKKTANTKFDSSIEVHLRLGIDTKKGDQQVRSTVILPHVVGKSKKVAVFVDPSKEKEAKEYFYNQNKE